jgi:hypothetical protein
MSDLCIIPRLNTKGLKPDRGRPRARAVNGSLCLTRCDALEAHGVLGGQEIEPVDIDSQADWEEAERLVRTHLQGKP